MQKIEGDALRGHLENLILAVLARGEAHGLEILRRLESAGCGALTLKEGTLYPALYRMEESGLRTIADLQPGVSRDRQRGSADCRPRRRSSRAWPLAAVLAGAALQRDGVPSDPGGAVPAQQAADAA